MAASGDEFSYHGDKIFEPQRFEIQFRTELVNLVDDCVLETLVARHHDDGCIPAVFPSAEAAAGAAEASNRSLRPPTRNS